MSKRFTRKKEDFICDNCGHEVKGTGYTNHCPKCLWSKHVDIFPGDRLEPCQGKMKPIGIKKSKKGDDQIVHECVICGYRKNNKVASGDDVDKVIEVSKIPLVDK